MCDLVGVKKFLPKPTVKEFFFLTYNGVRFFSSIKRHERIFSLDISLHIRYFFLKSPVPLRPVKSQMVGPSVKNDILAGKLDSHRHSSTSYSLARIL